MMINRIVANIGVFSILCLAGCGDRTEQAVRTPATMSQGQAETWWCKQLEDGGWALKRKEDAPDMGPGSRVLEHTRGSEIMVCAFSPADAKDAVAKQVFGGGNGRLLKETEFTKDISFPDDFKTIGVKSDTKSVDVGFHTKRFVMVVAYFPKGR